MAQISAIKDTSGVLTSTCCARRKVVSVRHLAGNEIIPSNEVDRNQPASPNQFLANNSRIDYKRGDNW